MRTGRAYVMCSWEEVPHIAPEEKERLRRDSLPYQRKAREYGIPELGAGAIFPIDPDDITVAPFEIPKHYWRGYGFDTGWKWTAACSGAWDRDADIIYLTHAYKVSEEKPAVHAAAVKAMTTWQTGAADPSAEGAGKVKDGEGIMQTYIALGLNLIQADNAVEAGLLDMYNRMTTGRLKVFSTLVPWFDEMRLYRRVERKTDTGSTVRIVKENDHLMDASRYLIRTPECFGQEPVGTRPVAYAGSTGRGRQQQPRYAGHGSSRRPSRY